MAKVIDLTRSDGDLVILGRALVLPNTTTDTQPHPLNGSLRFNPEIGAAQLFHAGVWETLGGGSGGGTGDGTNNNHTHTIAQINTLANVLAGKAPIVHTHPISEIVGLGIALEGKANTRHTHIIEDITGLRGEIDGKAAGIHAHNVVIRDTIAASLPGSPPANYRLDYAVAIPLKFAANLAGSVFKVRVPPTNTYTIRMLKNGAEVGSMTFLTNGIASGSFAAPVELVSGDTLTFMCPVRDITISDISFSLLGTRQPQTTT